MESQKEIWGWTLSMDCRACNKNVLDPIIIERFGHELVREIGMTEFGLPQIVHFGKDNKTGYTWSQLLTTSNCCAHFCDESGDAYIDIFTCKPFVPETARNVVMKYFQPQHIESRFYERGV